MTLKRRQPPPKYPTARGRPTKYLDLNMEQVRKLATRGWTDCQMVDFFDISEDVWTKWKDEHPEFIRSLKDWKKEYDYRIEVSLAEAAEGYSHKEDKIFCQNGEVTVVSTTKRYPPNTTAAMFWLQNRLPEEWRNVQHREISGKVTVESTTEAPELDLTDFSTEELLVLRRAGIKLKASMGGDDGHSE